MPRVVITGLGVVTAVGVCVKECWKGMLNGIDSASKVTSFDTSKYRTHHACEIKNFKLDNNPNLPPTNPVHRYLYTATKEAVKDSGLDLLTERDTDRTGIAIGTLAGELAPFELLLRSNPEEKRCGFDMNVAYTYPLNSITTYLSEAFNLDGPTIISLNACSSGNHAIAWAFDIIQEGRADVMVVGGVESITQTEFTHFHNVKALAPERCQPFDKNRKGLLIGEGAGVMILENMDYASKRGANIYAELKGCGLSCDGYHMTAPHPEGAGAVKAMKDALQSARLSYDDIDYINVHGTGTLLNDRAEALAIHSVFKGHTKELPCSSIKSMIGHAMGAASAIESIICCLAIRDKVVPPTINYETKDPECDIDCVPNICRDVKVKNVMNNSFAFGGNNAVLIFGEV